MSAARDDILGGIRRALRRGPLPADRIAELAGQVAAHRRNLVPARAAALDRAGRIDLFVLMAEEVQTTVARVSSDQDVPAEVARYLAAENLPAELVAAPDQSLDAIPWDTRPLLHIRRGRAEADDAVSLTPCLAAVAETGTLMLASGPGTPTTLNFLPDTHIVVLHASQVVASYEDGWDLIRAQFNPPPLAGEGGSPQGGDQRGAGDPQALPRTINLITGPSRTGDIEQRIQLGAHGPRRLHVVLVGDAPSQG
jgi:L-lactate dehydrogenase complex protein LldG